MKPAAFEYHRPATLDEALALMARYGGDAKALAGGQSLIPAMNFRLSRPATLIDLNRIAELSFITPDGSRGLKIGAMARQRAVERSEIVAQKAPLIGETLPFVAHPQIRNRGTLGGSIAHADPSAELPAVMLALEARFRLRSAGSERSLPAADFFTGLFTTALAPDELLVEIHLPAAPAGTGWAFSEIARRHGDYALVGVASLVQLDSRERCIGARVALLSVGDGPLLAQQAARGLLGELPSEKAITAAAQTAAQQDIDPPADIHASAAYRRHLASVLVRRTLTRAFERARQSWSDG